MVALHLPHVHGNACKRPVAPPTHKRAYLDPLLIGIGPIYGVFGSLLRDKLTYVCVLSKYPSTRLPLRTDQACDWHLITFGVDTEMSEIMFPACMCFLNTERAYLFDHCCHCSNPPMTHCSSFGLPTWTHWKLGIFQVSTARIEAPAVWTGQLLSCQPPFTWTLLDSNTTYELIY